MTTLRFLLALCAAMAAATATLSALIIYNGLAIADFWLVYPLADFHGYHWWMRWWVPMLSLLFCSAFITCHRITRPHELLTTGFPINPAANRSRRDHT